MLQGDQKLTWWLSKNMVNKIKKWCNIEIKHELCHGISLVQKLSYKGDCQNFVCLYELL